MKRKLESLYIKSVLKMNALKDKVLYDENGDTNFISIIIVIGIVLALAVVLKGYIGSITGKVETDVNSFTSGI
ncbi:MAG: hypothetical protein ACI4ES_14630 [Roseburia sp.]